MTRRLSLFLPGAFANLGEELRTGFADHSPETVLEFHRFIPSGDLAQLILSGAPADVFVSANPEFMDRVVAAGLAQNPVDLAGNRLCIISRVDLPETPLDVPALIASHLRVVVPQPETDPCGRYIADLMRRICPGDVVARRLAEGSLLYSHGSGDLPGFVRDGRVEAGILYFSETLALGNDIRVTELPADQDCHERIRFVIAPISRSGGEHPAAAAFVRWITGVSGQSVLHRAGFMPPLKTCAL